MAARLAIGPVDVDPSVRERVDTETLQRLVARHRRGDWGQVDARDARANVRAAYLQQGRLRSVYRVGRDLLVWVITTNLGSDSLHTLVLIPQDD
ncbi:hypothetical protein KQ313_07170 [Synechococcus sp. CS-1325]|uniref:hypothetical protein n=1 Tax=unclassified Synechococcus TaxID=2626047 RepID=UPI000DB531E5|nr:MULTISPECIES: hypothetical protein [unclassified Synechococcus]MCT0199455.1 hypothetical protein [Synechococcus sp. CS-1325]MCT0214516.1 hypothetical protein [Synechococcus sp. CS-1326]MCT0233181.1 hypothetical protein [Synechococcus sp. CS-1327]PZV03097.1 MAG: hypothetical protein DCF24_00555 [Cyanobium sp.]